MNRPCLQYTRFVDLSEEGNEIEETWGYRLYDDYSQLYNNTFNSFEELRDVVNRTNILQFLWDNHFEFAAELDDKGLYFNDDWITPEELRQTKGDD